MNIKKKIFGLITALAVTVSLSPAAGRLSKPVSAAEDISSTMTWDAVKIGGAGFVSGIVRGKENMLLRTDVGGAYKYNYSKMKWEQLLSFVNEQDKGFLSVSGMAFDPTDDDIFYLLCGCAYFSDARTAIFKTTDGGKTFTETDVTDMIQVHGNGDGRECIEPIAVDPDNPNIIYAGGDVYAGKSCLIKSTDAGKTWEPVTGYSDAVTYPYTILWPFWTDHEVHAITTDGEQSYANQNGICNILIEDGKVYVGTAVNGQTNIHVADVSKDKFTALSEDLPTENYPLSITSDRKGNIYFTYIAGLAFNGMKGGAYKYEKATGKVTKLTISEKADNAIGMIEVDPTDPNKMVARTCGVWGSQLYEEWTEEVSPAWGDQFFRSADGGKTWQDITPGAKEGPWGQETMISNYIDTNGYDWIYGKACHWGSSIIMDPRNPEHIYLTSGNGVFRCDNTWDEKGVQVYFDPNGVEECVCLDMVSIPGRNPFSAIGDYDGFEHTDVNVIGLQYKPNMGSTSAIAYCPKNPDVMVRIANGDGNNQGTGYYTKDGGKTWSPMKCTTGGKAAVTQLSDSEYRIFLSGSENGSFSYSDDWGATWNSGLSVSGNKPTYFLVDPDDPATVYASGVVYNSYWSSDPNKKEPTFDECHYSLYVSHDYGKTWEDNQVCRYDMCDHTGDPAYVTKDTVAMAAGWNGLYIITDKGSKAEKLDSVFYCKTVGYGAPEKSGGVNTLFIYGRPSESDPEGIYRSSDAGKTWVCINTDKLYGGTGNGNFLVGDMNEFGTVYMSTVGAGIVYGKLTSNVKEPPVTEPPVTKPTTKPTTQPVTTVSEIVETSTEKKPETTVTTVSSGSDTTAVNTDLPVTAPPATTTKVTELEETTTTEKKETTTSKEGEVTVVTKATTTAETPADTTKTEQTEKTTASQAEVTTASQSPATETLAPETTTATEIKTTVRTKPTTEKNTAQVTIPSGIAANKYGDVNLDGKVDISDVVALNLYLINQEDYPLEAQALANADCIKDNVVNTSDSTIIMNFVAEIIAYAELEK